MFVVYIVVLYLTNRPKRIVPLENTLLMMLTSSQEKILHYVVVHVMQANEQKNFKIGYNQITANEKTYNHTTWHQ